MYLLNVSSIVSDEQLAMVKPSHAEWVNQGFKKGWFLAAGPKTKTGGGFILVKSMPSNELDQFINADPYVIEKVAVYEVTEFEIKAVADGLEQLKG